MLGAQARAAEYNAARNASARQASREAEEQKLPPKQAPLSLGSFAKTAAPNRNKGTKKYNPLILEETEEDEDPIPDEGFTETTPTKPPKDDANPIVDLAKPDSAEQIRVRMPVNPVPTAPRAMRPAADPFAASPQLGIDQTTTTLPPQYGPMAEIPFHGAYQYLDPAQLRALHIFNTGHRMNETPEGMRTYGNMMIPTDITPTKQEQKLSNISQVYANPYAGMIDPMGPFVGSAFAINPMQLPYQVIDPHGISMTQHWDATQHHSYVTGPQYQRPSLPHVHSDITPATRTDAPLVPRILSRHHSSIEDHLAFITPARAQQTSDSTSASRSKENEEPYDRSTKMKQFVAVQQAFAKAGKTVLNNPEARKSTEEKPPGVLEKKRTMDQLSGEIDELRMSEDAGQEAAVRIAPRVPPGFQDIASSNTSESEEQDEPVIVSDTDARLRQAFGVGTNDWFDLKPITRQERKKMSDTMKRVAGDLYESFRDPIELLPDPQKATHVRQWHCTDPRRRQDVRIEVAHIAEEYATRPRVEGESGSSESDNRLVSAGNISGAGNVLTNLTEYFSEYKDEDNAGWLNRTKPVPEFAIVSSSGSGFMGGSKSLFEDEQGGFHNAPSRIARDPRFRPQAREETQRKVEEEWSYRQDMYSRRRL